MIDCLLRTLFLCLVYQKLCCQIQVYQFVITADAGLLQVVGNKIPNTTAYHPECDGIMERFNRTLKTMLWKYVDQFNVHWDTYLPGLLWAY